MLRLGIFQTESTDLPVDATMYYATVKFTRVIKPRQLCWAGFIVMLMCVCVCVCLCVCLCVC